MTAKTILLSASRLCDSATVQGFANRTQTKVRMQLKRDGRVLFCMVHADGREISPLFSTAHGLIQHIYMREEDTCHNIRVRL